MKEKGALDVSQLAILFLKVCELIDVEHNGNIRPLHLGFSLHIMSHNVTDEVKKNTEISNIRACNVLQQTSSSFLF